MKKKMMLKAGAGVSSLLLGTVWGLCGQKVLPPRAAPPDVQSQNEPSPQSPANPAPSTPAESSRAATPDHAAAYYHYMLARRYGELAGMYNRNDYVEKAISEYQQAIQADPSSLFLKVELAELYSSVDRVGDAITEVQEVLKVNPDDVDAHRLLARIYARSLGESQPNTDAAKALGNAIHEYEEVTRLDPKDAESALVLGRLYKLNNQPEKAESLFKKVIETNPDSRTAIVQLAQLYSDKGEYRQAVDLLKKVPDDEMDPGLLGMLGYAYAQVGDNDNAEAAYQKALSIEPENQSIRRAYAEALMSDGKTDEARAQLEKILKTDPEDASTYLSLAELDRGEGNFDEARTNLARAQSLAPDSLEVAYQQALLEDQVGNDDKAIAILNQLLKQTAKPEGQYTLAETTNRAAFLERLGLIYRAQEKYDLAMDEFKQIVALGDAQAPRGEGLIVETLRLKHQPDKAMQEANAAIEKYPKNRSLKLLRDSLLGEQGHVDQAVADLQSMLTQSPTDREIDLSIGQIYSQAKRYPDAEAAVQKALALSPKPGDQEYALFMLGSVYEREKKYDLAEQLFQKVLKQDPLNDAAANYLGYMLADRGVRLKESLQYIQKAVQLEPNNGAYLDSLGWAYFKMKRYDQAQAPLEKAVHLISDDPTIREHLGYVYLMLGMKEQARQQWELALKLWPSALSSDFGPADAAKLRKQLDGLKVELAKKKSGDNRN